MYKNNLIFKMIKARIFHSYETYMDNSMGQLDIHMETLLERFDPQKFTEAKCLEKDIIVFLTGLQKEVNVKVGAASYGMVIDQLKE